MDCIFLSLIITRMVVDPAAWQRRDPLSEVGIRARALAQLGMVSGTWVTITVAGGAAKAGAR